MFVVIVVIIVLVICVAVFVFFTVVLPAHLLPVFPVALSLWTIFFLLYQFVCVVVVVAIFCIIIGVYCCHLEWYLLF